MEEKKEKVDIITILIRIWKRKWLFLVVVVLTAICSSLYILPEPRYYTCNVVLAPENSMANEGALGSITSAIGVNFGGAMSNDAIFPELYPKVLESNDFINKLVNIEVESLDGSLNTTYYNYIHKCQKVSPVKKAIGFVRDSIRKLFSSDEKKKTSKNGEINLFNLTKEQNEVFTSIIGKIDCGVDVKTGLITISVQDQDPLICATVADSVRTKLQDFIIEYRTSKSRVDVEYYKKLTTEAKMVYEKARQGYGSYADQNTDVIIQSYKLKENELENDMQLKFNSYTTLQNQLQMAEAKLQERTPAFTVIKGASVPQKPTGPKRMLFVAVMILLAVIFTSFYVCRDLVINEFKAAEEE